MFLNPTRVQPRISLFLYHQSSCAPSPLGQTARLKRSLTSMTARSSASSADGKKTVAVIGAGASGLVAARYLLEAGLSPTILEKAPAVGGLWGRELQDQEGSFVPDSHRSGDLEVPSPICWKSLRTNASRFTCCFSDHPWPDDAPLFPSQPEMREYLASYARRFLGPDPTRLLQTSTAVTDVSPADNGTWQVTTSRVDKGGSWETSSFDYVVVASGIFEHATVPEIPGLDKFPGLVIHSGSYTVPAPFQGKRVAVIGASFSGVDIASDVASVASHVTHIITHGFWLLPRFLPLDSKSPSTPFLPLDLVFYRRSLRGASAEVTVTSAEQRQARNRYFSSILGDQASLYSPALEVGSEDHPHVGISDDYGFFIQAGNIDVKRGRVTTADPDRKSLLLDNGQEIENIDAVILCTGFKPSLPFFSEELKKEVSFDQEDRFQPMLLHKATFHPSLPGVAFTGMYRGPYFSQMELQARWAAAVFGGKIPSPSHQNMQQGIQEELRVKAQRPRPQLPHGDYIGYSDSLASELGFRKSEDCDWLKENDIVIPSQYHCDDEKRDVVSSARESLHKACTSFAAGRGVPAAVFRGLVRKWKLRRQLISRHKGLPSGFVEGTASFTPLPKEHELLYKEEGVFTSDTGFKSKVWKEYIYKCEGPEAPLSVLFCEKGKKTYLFHQLQFLEPGAPMRAEETRSVPEEFLFEGWRAVGDHDCGEDKYLPAYRFAFSGCMLSKFSIIYQVSGPEKDYTSCTMFQPE